MTRVYPTFNAQHFTFQVRSVVNSENISHSLGHFPHWYFIDLVSVQHTKYSPKVWHKRCCFVHAPMLDCLLTSCVQTYLFCVCCVQRVYCLESILSWTSFLALIVHFLLIVQVTFSLSCSTRVFGLLIYFIFML